MKYLPHYGAYYHYHSGAMPFAQEVTRMNCISGFSDSAIKALNAALGAAMGYGHTYIGSEHILFCGEIRFIPALGAELPGELHLVDSEVAQYRHGAAVTVEDYRPEQVLRTCLALILPGSE